MSSTLIKKVKVTHIITRLILGGAQENTVLSVEGLNKIPYYDIELISGPAIGPEGELINRVKQSGVKLHIINEMRRNINPILEIITFVKLFLYLVKTKPDVVHTHSSKAGILGRFAARWAGVKVVIHTIHGPAFHEYQSRAANWFFKACEIGAEKVTDKIVTVGEVMKEQAVAARVGKPDKFVVIYSGIEVEKFLKPADEKSIRRKYGTEDKIAIGMISRLFLLKGHEYLFAATANLKKRFPNIALMLIGDGALRGDFERQVEKLGIKENTIFTGLVKSEAIPETIKAIDILVHTSFREGLPRAIPQALISGKPVVAFDVDGAKEVVIDSKTGYLVPPADADKLTEAIAKVIESPDLGKKLGEEGKRLFAEQFSAKKMVNDLDKLYREHLKWNRKNV